MDWQEYQESIALLYEQLEGIGNVRRNVYIPDRVTGQRRQIDVLIEMEERGHRLSIVVDAKFRKEKIDVKDVEELAALCEAVGGCKAVLAAANGWTSPASAKAHFQNIDLMVVTLEDALDLLVPDKWSMCFECNDDCVVLDHDGAVEIDNSWLWWLAGQCRKCRSAFAWCQECGEKIRLPAGESRTCLCGYTWCADKGGMQLFLPGSERPLAI